MTSETPFQIDIPDEKLTILRAKLELASFPNELEDARWKYGAPLADIKRLTERWKNSYNWRKYEKEINEQLPMFTCDIDVDGFGVLNIHYVHKKSETVDAIPLLFCHGWPGSFLEVGKILPFLTSSAPEHPSFHVVVLSLPGFGFSEAPHKQGFAIDQYAEVAHKLMLALRYNEYVTHGGDWGSLITRRMASVYGGRHLKAWHTNSPLPKPPSWRLPLFFLSFLLTPWSTEEKAGIERTTWFQTKGQGYYHEQSTQPQTLGYMLTWISLYWFSRNGPAASLRIYFELRSNCEDLGQSPTIPMGASFFPKELIVLPTVWLCKSHNVVFESHHKTGGHFAATEVPEELAQDIWKMFVKGGPAFAIVPGRTGYA
ncbi:Alpha/Beta hydrolase protein [Suillus fuscotomentosus]|uniref:Alpha/Beta hydrolase protein n=1 Tax=Suillus fuscotomentosus TaxID=1912939 RepID=A0AAD4E9Z8_9AGAM|nr:Alpha/Beta hydrolase protein [Suillus fuscotomentosus]KAG1902331.1 Alpha/Beta hydrolase protein [Suillus fuscotomentosus]